MLNWAVVMHTFNPSTQQCELEVSLVSRVKFQGYTRNPVSKTKHEIKINKKKQFL